MIPADDWKRWYDALRAANANAFYRAMEYAEGVSLNHDLPLSVAAELERSHVMLACEILGVKP